MILICAQDIVCLCLTNGRLALPGGAVDARDLLLAPGQALFQAARREVAEETGIDIEGCDVQFTGLYVGGYPTHVLGMLRADLSNIDIAQAISTFRPADALDQVESIELRSLSELVEAMSDLPLVMRAALRSLRHRDGNQPAWTITA